jgi:hypothetical protein
MLDRSCYYYSMAGKPKRPRDANQLAKSIVDLSTDTGRFRSLDSQEVEKNAAAVMLGRMGGLKGGKARAEKLSAKRRTEIAKKAAKARWADKDS